MQIIIKTSKGKEYKVEAPSREMTIGAVKEDLLRQMEMEGKQINLLWKGQMLKDEHMLKDYDFADEVVKLGILVKSKETKLSPEESAPPEEEKDSGYSLKTDPSRESINNQRQMLSSFIGGAQGAGTPGGNKDFQEQMNQLNELLQQQGVGTGAQGGGGFNPAQMGGMPGGSGEMQQAFQQKMKELMKNPEQMKALLETSFVLNNIPEAQKVLIREQFDRMNELMEENPEQYNRLMDHLINSSDLSNMNMNMNGFMPPNMNMNMNMNTSGMPQGASSDARGSRGPGGFHQIRSPNGDTLVYSSEIDLESVKKTYAEAFQQLKEMGYDENTCLLALHYAEGNLNNAVDIILQWQQFGPPSS
ncbi:hypothetical protein NECID01_0698 [Nematocida sp. AWRm77]|nr:hypothetical protein NECID01_0698 [Nematocida sp. AWRm77]